MIPISPLYGSRYSQWLVSPVKACVQDSLRNSCLARKQNPWSAKSDSISSISSGFQSPSGWMEEFGCQLTFAETKSGEQSLFQISILVVSRWSRKCIEGSAGCFLIQCSNYMVILCSIICDLADVKLCFSLQEPYHRLLCPESGALDSNCVSLPCSSINSLLSESGSPMKCITTPLHKNCVTTDFIQHIRIVYQYYITAHKT